MRHHAAWILLLAACSTSVAPPPTSDVPTATGAVAERPAAPAPTAKPTVEPVDRAQVLREVAATCEVERKGDTTIDMKEGFAEELRCHEKVVVEAVGRTGGAEARFQPRWAEATKTCCRLTEESAWVDPDAGTRDWGSIMGFAELNCRIARHADRAFFLRAKQRGDAAAVWAHFQAVSPEKAQKRQDMLSHWTKALAALPDPGPKAAKGHLSRGEIAELKAHVEGFVDGTPSLGGALCGDWPALREAAGGRAACVAAATAHLTRCLQPSPYAGE